MGTTSLSRERWSSSCNMPVSLSLQWQLIPLPSPAAGDLSCVTLVLLCSWWRCSVRLTTVESLTMLEEWWLCQRTSLAPSALSVWVDVQCTLLGAANWELVPLHAVACPVCFEWCANYCRRLLLDYCNNVLCFCPVIASSQLLVHLNSLQGLLYIYYLNCSLWNCGNVCLCMFISQVLTNVLTLK